MKEEIDIKKDLYICCPLLNKECKKDSCYIHNGECRLTTNKEYSQQELIDRINKAIEYIENNWIEYSDFEYVDNDDELNIDCESIKELLDILKGNKKD